jgi:hypothetical protein
MATSQRSILKANCTTNKEIQLRRFLFALLASCLLSEAKFKAARSDKWAGHYREQARLVRKRIGTKKTPLPIYRCVVFYPEGEGWRESELFTSKPELVGVISPGMQSMVDGLLSRTVKAA